MWSLAPKNLSCIFHFRALPCDIMFRLGIGQMLPLHAVLVFKSNKRGEVLEPTTKILEIVWSCRIFMEILWKGEKSEVEGNVNICHSLSTIWVCHPPTHIELPTVYTLHGESQMFAFAHCVSLNSVYIIATRYYKDILPLPLLLVSSSVYIVSTKWWRLYLGSAPINITVSLDAEHRLDWWCFGLPSKEGQIWEGWHFAHHCNFTPCLIDGNYKLKCKHYYGFCSMFML